MAMDHVGIVKFSEVLFCPNRPLGLVVISGRPLFRLGRPFPSAYISVPYMYSRPFSCSVAHTTSFIAAAALRLSVLARPASRDQSAIQGAGNKCSVCVCVMPDMLCVCLFCVCWV